MTPEENQRQRHLAEMMLAQCDGKIVQTKLYSDNWRVIASLPDVLADHLTQWDNGDLQIRIKPEPREWWICERCSTRSMVALKCPHFPYQSNAECTGSMIHVREVLGAD
jgi:hypothetical protein